VIPHRVESSDPAPIHAASHNASVNARQLQFGASTRQHPRVRFQQRTAATDVEQVHFLAWTEQPVARPGRVLW
jgi:hypothetical protein